jgi:hypothetical protein
VTSSRVTRRFDFAHLVLWIELSIIAFFCLRPTTDPDYGWHIANGRHVFDGLTFSARDIYSWTATNVWVAHEWLAEAVMSVVDQSFGPTGNSVLFGVIGVITYAVLALMLRRRARWAVVLPALAICFAGSLRSIGARPQMLELMYLVILLNLIDVYLTRGITRKTFFLASGVGAALWANTHGSFPLAAAVLVITAVELWLAKDSHWKDFGVAAVISAVAPLANPWGWNLYGFATQSITSQTTLVRIEEWQRPHLTDLLAAPLLLQLGLAAIAAAAVVFKRKRSAVTSHSFPWTLGLLRSLAFAFLALKSGRHVMLFGIAAAPLIAAGLDLLVRRASFVRSSARSKDSDKSHQAKTLINVAAALIVSVGIIRVAWGNIAPSAQRDALAARYPVGIVAGLPKPLPPSERLLNEYGWGGFLIQRGALPVFIDGRSELYGDAQLERYASIIHLDAGWRDVLDKLGVTLALMPRDAALSRALESGGWKIIARDSVGYLFARP